MTHDIYSFNVFCSTNVHRVVADKQILKRGKRHFPSNIANVKEDNSSLQLEIPDVKKKIY